MIICKECGSTEGFYVNERVSGVAIIYYDREGNYGTENYSIYDNMRHSGGKKAYCKSCDKYMGKSIDLKAKTK